MLQHDRLERSIRRDHAVSGSRARENRAAERKIAGALEHGPSRAGRAELLEPLGIEDERRGASRAAARVAEHACTQPVYDVDLSIADEVPGHASRTQSEDRI